MRNRTMNQVLLIGSVTHQPELRYTTTGKAMLDFSIAGESEIQMEAAVRNLAWYHRVSVFGTDAETWIEHLQAGTALLIEGSLDYRTWETQDGQKRNSVQVKPNHIERLNRPESDLVQDMGGGFRLSKGTNEVRLIGNLGRDIEVRQTPQGETVASVSLAVSESWKVGTAGNERHEKTHWFEMSFWKALAQRAASLRKGDPIWLSGRLKNDSWVDKDGNKRSTSRIEVLHFEALERLGSGKPAPVESETPAV